MNSNSPTRCVLLSEMLQPYRIPVFNRIAERPEIDLTVLLLSIREANRKWEVPLGDCRFVYEVLPGFDFYIRSLDWGLHFSLGLGRALERIKPDVVVGTGYASPAYLKAQRWSRQQGAGYVLWSGSTQATSRIGKGPLLQLKRAFAARCDAFLSYGTRATAALKELGAEPNRIVTGCNTVDTEFFARIAEEARRAPGFEEWRARFPERIALFVGQMIERKGVSDLLKAYRKVDRSELGLILVGDGPDLPKWKKETQDWSGLFWEGYVQTGDLGPYLAAADVLAMPSKLEVWGLVANEAMAAGVPVIATSCSGATADLIREGKTGRSFEAGDVDTLAELLCSVVDRREEWAQMGRNAADLMKSRGPDAYAEAFVRAVEIARSGSG